MDESIGGYFLTEILQNQQKGRAKWAGNNLDFLWSSKLILLSVQLHLKRLSSITGNYIWGLTSMGNALWENLYKSEYTLSNFVLTDWLVYDT